MKSKLLLTFLTMLLSFAFVQAQNTWYVNDNSTTGDVYTSAVGNDANAGTAAAPFLTIAKAVSSANVGDIIKVDAGSYNESPTINKALTLNGTNAGIDPNTGSRVAEAILYNGGFTVSGTGSVVIDGFNIKQDGTTAIHGVNLTSAGGAIVTVQNILFDRNTTVAGSNIHAVYLSNSTGLKTIQNNKFTGSTTYAYTGSHKTWRSAVWLNGGFVTIKDNVIDAVNTGLNMESNQSNYTITGNTFKRMGTGLAIGSITTAHYSTLGANEFFSSGGPTTLINLTNTVNPGFRLDISAGTYGGTPFANLPLSTYFTTFEGGSKITGQKTNGMVYYVANHIYVRATGNNSNLQTAIDLASTSQKDILVVQGSNTVRNESVTIAKSLELHGAQFGTAVTSRTPTASSESKWRNANGSTPVVTLNAGANDVVIDGFSIYANTNNSNGIYQAHPVSNMTVSNNFIRNFSGTLGVSVAAGADGFTIEKNSISGNYAGIYLSVGAKNGDINHNIITGHTDGSLDQGSAIATEANNSNIQIKNNDINNNGKGIYVWTGQGTTLTNFNVNDNSLTSNTAGVVNNLAGTTVNATCNWWGTDDLDDIAGMISGEVDAKMRLNSGTNTATGPGFESDGDCIGPVHNITQNTYYGVIQSAVNAANDNDIIEVAAGTYPEAVTVNKAVTIKGANAGIAAGNDPGTRGAETILDGAFKMNAAGTIDGFKIINGYQFGGSPNKDGILVASAGVTVTNSIVEDVTGSQNTGIEVGYHDNFTLTNSSVINNWRGIYLNPSSGDVLSGNLIDGNSYGLSSDELSNFSITSSTISNNSGEGWGASTVGSNVVANGNNFTGNGVSIAHYGGNAIDATGNFWVTTDYSTILGNVSGDVIFVPYKSIETGPADKLNAKPDALTLTYTKASEDILVELDVTRNNLELKPIPGLNPNVPADLLQIQALYLALNTALIGGDSAAIQAAVLDIGDDIITEYYYLDNLNNKVYLKTAGGNPLVKNKYWDKYLVRDSDSVRLPDWAGNQTKVTEDGYRSHTNPGTGSVSAGWLDPVLGKTVYVVTTFLHNGSVNSDTASVAIDAGPVMNVTQNRSFRTIQIAIDSAVTNDVIEVAAGTYNEVVTVNKAVTLKGANATVDPRPSVMSSRVIDGPNETIISGTKAQTLVTIAADNVVIDGFEFKQTGTSGNGHTINTTSNFKDITFTNNIVYNTGAGNALRLYGGDNFLIQQNYLKDISGEGIVLRNGNNQSTPATNQKIQDNDIINVNGVAGGAINTYGETDLEISGNIIEAKYQGVSIGAGGHAYYDMKNINVHHNTISVELNTSGGTTKFALQVNGLGTGVNVHNNIIAQSGSNVTSYPLIRVGYDADASTVTNPSGLVFSNNYLSMVTGGTGKYFYIAQNITNFIEAYCNWFGTSDFVAISGLIEDKSSTNFINGVTYLTSGTNTVGSGPGFEAEANACFAPVHNVTKDKYFATIQAAVNSSITQNGDVIVVSAGTYNEDVNVTKSLTISGADATTTIVSGPKGGGNATFRVSAAGVIIENFTITRDGNNTTDWNDATLNSAGVAIQSQGNTATIRNNIITGNRTGIDVNNSNGNTIIGNTIDFNRTGLLFRNQTDNTNMTNNFIRDNWTVGVLFLDASGGTNVPVQSAINSNFNDNNISGNWYGDIVDRQIGGSLPTPGTSNMKNFDCNWYGIASPVVSIANSAEPGYAAQIPVAYGGTATNPGNAPNILGEASANFDYVSWLTNGADDQTTTTGFQPVPGSCSGTSVELVSAIPTVHTCDAFGSIDLTWTGGTANYTVSWSGAASGSQTGLSGTSTIIPDLITGSYVVTVTDTNGTVLSAPSIVIDYHPVKNTSTGETFATIQGAIDASTTVNGDTIVVCAGTYTENVAINKNITLTSKNGSGSTTIAPASGRAIELMGNVNKLENVTVKGFTLTVAGAAIALQSNSQVNNGYDVDGLTYEDLVINAPDGYAIGLFDVKNVTLDNVTITGADTGIEMVGVSDMTIKNSAITGSNKKAINLGRATGYENNSNITITNSTISEVKTNVIAIDLKSVTGILTLEGNTISKNTGFGFRIDNDPTDAALALTISKNTFKDNGGVAVYLEDDNLPNVQITAKVKDNTFDGNRKALGSELIDNLEVTGNLFHNSTQNAVEIGVENVLIESNSFEGNLAANIKAFDGYSFEADNNWWGTTSVGDINNKITGNITYCSFLDDGSNSALVGFDPTGNNVNKFKIATAALSGGGTYCFDDVPTLTIDFTEANGTAWADTIAVTVELNILGADGNTYKPTFTTTAADWRSGVPTYVSLPGFIGVNTIVGATIINVDSCTINLTQAEVFALLGIDKFTVNPEPNVYFTIDQNNTDTGINTNDTFTFCEDETITVKYSAAGSIGTAPFAITYTINGVAQDTVMATNDGDVLFSGKLNAGTHLVQVTSITDANGCSISAAKLAAYTFTVKINATPAKATQVSDIAVCNATPGINLISFTSSNIDPVTYHWTNSNTSIGLSASGVGDIAAFTATNNTEVPQTATISVIVKSADGCESEVMEFTITINPALRKPAITPNESTICEGSSILLQTQCYGNTATWSNGETGNNITVSPIANTTYSVKCVDNLGCESEVSEVVTVNVIPRPATPVLTASATTVCKGTSVTLTATASCDGGEFVWSHGVTTLLNTINVTSEITQTYSVICNSLSPIVCGSAVSNEITITVHEEFLASPTVSPDVIISSGASTVLTASCPSGTPAWFDGFGDIVGSGSSFTTPNLIVNTEYNVKCVSDVNNINDCKSVGHLQKVSIDPFALVNQPNDIYVCLDQNAFFQVGATGRSVGYQWQISTDGNTWTNIVNDTLYNGANASILSITAPQEDMSDYRYRCIITNTAPDATEPAITSIAAYLAVHAAALGNNLTLHDPIVDKTRMYQVVQTINADNKISGTSKVKYFGGNSITLEPGFEVSPGSVFTAKVQVPCTNSGE